MNERVYQKVKSGSLKVEYLPVSVPPQMEPVMTADDFHPSKKEEKPTRVSAVRKRSKLFEYIPAHKVLKVQIEHKMSAL